MDNSVPMEGSEEGLTIAEGNRAKRKGWGGEGVFCSPMMSGTAASLYKILYNITASTHIQCFADRDQNPNIQGKCDEASAKNPSEDKNC